MRKNPWIKRKAKILYGDLNKKIESDEEYSKHSDILNKKSLEADELVNDINLINEKFIKISEKLKTKSPDLLIEALPIENTKDFYDIEYHGKLTKPTYSDFSELIKTAKVLDKISIQVEKTEEEERILKIEQLILKINKILEINN